MTTGAPNYQFGSVGNKKSADAKILQSIYNRLHEIERVVNAIGYDSKAAKKRRFPVKRQQAVLRGISRALCVETVDPWKENRVRYYHPVLHDPRAKLLQLPFARPVSAMGGHDDCGLNWVPPAGSTLIVYFEGGNRNAAFYLGTTWSRDRGPDGQKLQEIYPSREWDKVYKGRGANYFVKTDGSETLPPWNTESYNASDINHILQFITDPQEQRRITYPNIYGFKTPEKHMLKMVDGNAKCNRRWKRVELMSGDGNWLIFKDDHLHYGGQWAHPNCPPAQPSGNQEICSDHEGLLPYFTDLHGKPKERESRCGSGECTADKGTSCSEILGGHPSTPCDSGGTDPLRTSHCNTNQGANKFFKVKNECRPYRGPNTPQNNRCDLPQSGIQFLSLSGHSFLMDDSVEEPRDKPGWKRSLKDFDFGCNDKFVGRTRWISATGHSITMSDVEADSQLRGKDNYIRLLTASGNKIELNDHTEGNKDCPGSPPNHAGDRRGITMQTTSRHSFKMIDHMNQQASPCRKEGGVPVSKATQAYIEAETGYGLQFRMSDDNSQEKTDKQYIQILHKQCKDPDTDTNCNACDDNVCRGPHLLRFQGAPKGQPGIVFLRAGGYSVRMTYDTDVVVVGDKDKNKADKFTYVSKNNVAAAEDDDFRYAGKKHILFCEDQILLIAGRDCQPAPASGSKSQKKCAQPCLFGVVVARCPIFCPITQILHWTERSVSERVFASAYHPCKSHCTDVYGNPNPADCSSYNSGMAAAAATCTQDKQNKQFNTGAGTVTVPVQTQPKPQRL